MATTEEWRKQFTKYKSDVKKRGKPFFPYAMFHDTVMSLVVVSVIIGLAAVWYYTSGEDPKTCGSGDSCLLGPRYSEPADPGTTNFVPRPDWYFYFLFYLLRIFKWPDSVILGTVGIPTILLIIALLLPFIDRRMERRLTRRPVAVIAAVLVVISMGVLTYKGATAKEALASEVVQAVPTWAKRQGFADNPDAVAGAKVFASSGCTALPHLPRHRQLQPRRTGPVGDRKERSGAGLLLQVRCRPVEVRQQRDAEVRLARRAEAASARRVPERIQRPEIGPRCASSSA